MTPEARAFRGEIIQYMRRRISDWRYSIWRKEQHGEILWRRDLMLVGAVLLPAEPTPEPTPDEPNPEVPIHHLDYDYVRAFLRQEAAVHPGFFIRRVNDDMWKAAIQMGDEMGSFGDRFYSIVYRDDDTWGLYSVPTQAEKDAPNSPYGPHTITLPEFTSVTHDMRLTALGL